MWPFRPTSIGAFISVSAMVFLLHSRLKPPARNQPHLTPVEIRPSIGPNSGGKYPRLFHSE
jgi:hypothetical protein